MLRRAAGSPARRAARPPPGDLRPPSPLTRPTPSPRRPRNLRCVRRRAAGRHEQQSLEPSTGPARPLACRIQSSAKHHHQLRPDGGTAAP